MALFDGRRRRRRQKRSHKKVLQRKQKVERENNLGTVNRNDDDGVTIGLRWREVCFNPELVTIFVLDSRDDLAKLALEH